MADNEPIMFGSTEGDPSSCHHIHADQARDEEKCISRLNSATQTLALTDTRDEAACFHAVMENG